MPAKSVSGRSRASKSTIDDSKSFSGKYIKEPEKIKLSSASKEAIEKYQAIMSEAKKNIAKLFLNDETKKHISDEYYQIYQMGLNICKLGPKNFIDENVSDFFLEWTKLSNTLYHYYDFDPNERYTQFIDEITKKIALVVQPLRNFVFDESYPNEAKKAKKQAKSEQDSFDNSMTLMSQQTYKYFKGKISVDVFTQTIKQLIANVTSYSNLFFHQPREDATEILYQTQTYLNKILDAVIDYYGDEKSFKNWDTQLSKLTLKLELLFKPKNQNNSNPELQQNVISGNDNSSEEEEESDKKYIGKKHNKQHISFRSADIDDDNQYEDDDEVDIENTKKSSNKENKNDKQKVHDETVEELRDEISELKQSIKIISRKISNITRKRASNDDTGEDNAKKIDLSFNKNFLNEVIEIKQDFNSKAEDELEKLRSINLELVETNGKISGQPFNSSSKQIKRELVDIDDSIQALSDELDKYQKLTSKSSKIRFKQSTKDDIAHSLIELNVQNDGLQFSIDDMKAEKKKLIEEEEELGASQDPANQTLNDMLFFLNSRKNELNEIESYFENSEPIQKPKKISRELEAYRDDKFVDDSDDEFWDTKKELEKARKVHDSYLSQLNDSFKSLLKCLADENKDTIELFKMKLNNDENDEFEASHSIMCKVRDEMMVKFSLKNRMDTIKNWLKENFLEYNDQNITVDQKLKLILKDIKSRNRKK